MVDTIENFKKFLSSKNFKKIFVLCGENSLKASGANNLLAELETKKELKVYYKKYSIPVLEELIIINEQIKIFKPDLLLGIGGGAVIDYAKIANVIDNRTDISELIINYSYPIKKKFTKLAVIPTTAGSGAEVTSNAVIYVNGIKYSFESDILIPDYFFLIPDFVKHAPFNIKASSGFDAIAQSLESIVSKKSNDKSLEFAIKSLEISLKYFNNYLENPNEENSSQMCIAANLAGKAINISKTTAPHATSYPFSSLFKLGHGHAVSLFFENFFKYNFDNINKSNASFDLGKRFEIIFSLFKVNNISDFSAKISQIKKNARLEDNLLKLNIDINKNSERIMSGINLLRMGNNPVGLTKNEILKILNESSKS